MTRSHPSAPNAAIPTAPPLDAELKRVLERMRLPARLGFTDLHWQPSPRRPSLRCTAVITTPAGPVELH
jgi:hypothetical protein